MKRREVSAPDVEYDPKVQIYGISLEEWDAMQKRLMRVEELLIANGAPMKSKESDPSATDVLRTIKMAFADSKIAFHLENLNYSGYRAWSEFRFGSSFYTITVEREDNV